MNGLLIIHEEITKENQSRIGGAVRDNYAKFRFDFLKFDNVKHACLCTKYYLIFKDFLVTIAAHWRKFIIV